MCALAAIKGLLFCSKLTVGAGVAAGAGVVTGAAAGAGETGVTGVDAAAAGAA